MDDAALLLRIRVVLVSTRAAVRSLRPTDPQRPEVLARGLALLDDLERNTSSTDGRGMSDRLAAARAELLAIEVSGP
jgi:hypothetical protein